MSITAIVEALVGAGATPEMILAAVRAAEADTMAREEARKAGQRDRVRRHRERNAVSRDVTLQTVTSPPSPFPPAPPVTPSPPIVPPSLPSEGQTPRGSRSAGSRLSPDWKPNERHYAAADERGLSTADVEACAAEMREWAQANSNRPIARKADWDATFHGFLRRYADRRARAGPKAGEDRYAAFRDILTG